MLLKEDTFINRQYVQKYPLEINILGGQRAKLLKIA